jgi:hypothetical protein
MKRLLHEGPDGCGHFAVPPREVQVLGLMGTGSSNQESAMISSSSRMRSRTLTR